MQQTFLKGRLLSRVPAKLRPRVLLATGKGVLKNMAKYAFSTPHGVKANCYSFFLTFHPTKWRNRLEKLQPGYRCPGDHPPLDFARPAVVKQQLLHRIQCDNPHAVFHLPPPPGGYPPKLLQMRLPPGFVLGVGIVGPQDYHFLRREGIAEILASPTWRRIWKNSNQNVNMNTQLTQAKNAGHKYCWAHVAGWSGRVKLKDGNNKLILNPVHQFDTGKNVRRLRENRCSHAYSGLTYDRTVGFFLIKVHSAVPDVAPLPNIQEVQQALRNVLG